VRITAQLIDATTGGHLWADRFDGSLEDFFELRDQIAIKVAGIIEPALQAVEVRRSALSRKRVAGPDRLRPPCQSFGAVSVAWQGTALAASNLFDRAIARDPDTPRPWVGPAGARLARHPHPPRR
jgi:adenylate cyclase